VTETVRGLKSALAYTRLYRDQSFVVKLGGEILADSRALDTIAVQLALLESLSIRLVVVHGGGPQATSLAKQLGFETRMVAGRRVTTPEVLEVAKMVYAGTLNVNVTSALRRHGLRPVGLTGIDGGLIAARKRPPLEVRVDGGGTERVDYGQVGDLERIDTSLLSVLLDQRYVPVIASLAGDSEGQALNVNADTVAEAVASALGAKKLIFLTGVAGLLRDVTDPDSLIPFADVMDLEPLLGSGAVSGGMRPKVEACVRAVKAGVRRTHIVDGRQTDALLVEMFTGGGCGTMIVDRKEMTDYREHELS
jgi:acetylglutamate kinase